MFVLDMLTDALDDMVCRGQENQPRKSNQQYHSRHPSNASRVMAPPLASRQAAQHANHVAMSEQQERYPAASQPQSRARGGGGGQGEWSSRPPQNDGRPQQQRGPPNQQRGQNNRPQYSQDEMNLRDVGGSQGEWSSRQPQNDGRPQHQRGPHSWPQYSQDEMNLREVSSPRRQESGMRAGQGPNSKSQARRQQQNARQYRDEEEVSEVKDTIIGRGFTAAMKRGVAQAKPTPMYEEMVPQKDGGFIATIQKGFEGLFGGKPTSKEEVLRKRGAVYANEYEAVPGDEVDQRVQFFARRLPEDVAGSLKIFRKEKGQYQINDEFVNMEARFRQNSQGQTDKEIFVWWTTEEGEESDVEPLGLYLSHAANVAFEVQQGGNVITQVPEHVRMSFHEERGTKLTDGSADARFNAMEVAARQAKMREEAAMEWRERQNNKDNEAENQPPQQGFNQQGQKFQDRLPSLEGKPNGIIDDAYKGMGIGQQLAPGPVPVPQQLAAPASGMPGMAQPMTGFNQPSGSLDPRLQLPLGATSGTFYGVQQAPYGQQLPRQGTMYAYGSASPPGVMAAAAGGYTAATGAGYAPQRQGTMYAYGSAYAVPVR